MGLLLTLAPVAEPVTLAEVKAHCRIDTLDDDLLLSALILAARRLAESITGRALVSQSWKLLRDDFPAAAITLPLPPLQSVASVKYLDTAGVQQTLAPSAYTVHVSGVQGLIAPAYGQCWPATRDQHEAVEISFTAGYGAASAVPQEIKQWLLLAIGSYYTQRESLSPANVAPETLPRGLWDALLDSYRVVTFA